MTPATMVTLATATSSRHSAPAAMMTPLTVAVSNASVLPPITPAIAPTAASWWESEMPRLSLHHQIVLNRLRLMMVSTPLSILLYRGPHLSINVVMTS
jgi:hypothetical protein